LEKNIKIYKHPNIELFTRYEGNPILSPQMWPYKVNSVFNAGSIRFDGKTLLLVRVEDMRGFSHFSLAESEDGLTNWSINQKPFMVPETELYPEEYYGIEDPRLIKMEDEDWYGIIYCSYSRSGPLVSLATTEDFKKVKRYGTIMPPEDKDACLFPRKFKGRYALLHRPMPVLSASGAHIWISFSPDLIHWGNYQVLLPARTGGWWDSNKIGLSPPPIETEEGWLIIYHGVRVTASGSIYRLGLALLDLDDPTKVIRRGSEWVFGPREIYERVGDVPDVTFPCGIITEGDRLIMYYGAADTTMAVAFASIKELLDYLKYS
jgi:predicted GH43/DUF377 family glycosyl hydrolase